MFFSQDEEKCQRAERHFFFFFFFSFPSVSEARCDYPSRGFSLRDTHASTQLNHARTVNQRARSARTAPAFIHGVVSHGNDFPRNVSLPFGPINITCVIHPLHACWRQSKVNGRRMDQSLTGVDVDQHRQWITRRWKILRLEARRNEDLPERVHRSSVM